MLDCLRTGTKRAKLKSAFSDLASEDGKEEAASPMTKYLAKHNSGLAKPKGQAGSRGTLRQAESQKKIQLKRVKSEGRGPNCKK